MHHNCCELCLLFIHTAGPSDVPRLIPGNDRTAAYVGSLNAGTTDPMPDPVRIRALVQEYQILREQGAEDAGSYLESIKLVSVSLRPEILKWNHEPQDGRSVLRIVAEKIDNVFKFIFDRKHGGQSCSGSLLTAAVSVT